MGGFTLLDRDDPVIIAISTKFLRLGLYEKKNHPNKAEFRLHEEGIPLNWYIFYSYNIKTERFFDTFTIIRMRKPT